MEQRFNASVYIFDIHGAQGLMPLHILFIYMEHKVGLCIYLCLALSTLFNVSVYFLAYMEHKV